MKRSFAVIGLGTFGRETTRALYMGGATVLAVDYREDTVENTKDVASQAVCVDVNNESALEAAGVFDVDVVVLALRRHFDTTVLATHMFRKREMQQIIVQVNSEREASAVMAVGATSVIFPERDVALDLVERLLRPSLADRIPLGQDIGIIDVPCPEVFAGESLADLDLRGRFSVSIIAIRHPPAKQGKEETIDVVPAPDEPLKGDSTLVVIGRDAHLEEFRESLGVPAGSPDVSTEDLLPEDDDDEGENKGGKGS